MASSPHAKALLSLLSLLPDGIRAEDIMTSKVPILNVWHLKALSPICEYIQCTHPPLLALSNPLCTYFQDLVELWGSKHELPLSDLCPALVGFLGNINELILKDLLSAEKSTRADIGYTIITLDSFSATMLKGGSTLFQCLPHIIEETGGAEL
ncbi:hypothetical protein B0H14DRAFT_3529326 [Mycena olivaceomarginata]|nr:hypothetical protein B0H14DRAFT_3529326 [Mycena olivaceomarginata]